MALQDILDDGLAGIQHNFLTGKLEDLVNWSTGPVVLAGHLRSGVLCHRNDGHGTAHYDLARFGMEVFRASPRQADLMIVAGRVSQKMAPVLRQIYDQMMEPKWVISMGVCASSGGMFNNYAIVQGVDQIVPVDVYAPGCPPGPETLIHAITTLHRIIETGELLQRRSQYRQGPPRSIEQRERSGAGRRSCGQRSRRSKTTARSRPTPAGDADVADTTHRSEGRSGPSARTARS